MDLDFERRRRNIPVMSATTGLIVFVLNTWYFILPLYLHQQGATPGQISLSYALIALAAALPQFYGGVLADIYGRRLLIALPTFVAGCGYVLMLTGHAWQLIVGMFVMVNLASAFQGPSFTALISESVPPRSRGRAFAAFQFASGIASIAGPIIGGLLLPIFHVQGLIAFTAGGYLISATMRITLLRETKSALRPPPFRIQQAMRGPLGRLVVVSTCFMLAISLTFNGPFLSLLAGSPGGFNLKPQVVDVLFGVGPLFGVALSFVAARAIDRLGSRVVLVVGTFMHIVLLILWSMLHMIVLVFALFALSYAFYQAANIAFGSLRAEVAAAFAAGPALGVVGLISGVGASLGPILGGVLSGRFGLVAPVDLALVFALIAALVAQKLPSHPQVSGHDAVVT